jgi:hypothetical protein
MAATWFRQRIPCQSILVTGSVGPEHSRTKPNPEQARPLSYSRPSWSSEASPLIAKRYGQLRQDESLLAMSLIDVSTLIKELTSCESPLPASESQLHYFAIAASAVQVSSHSEV